MINQFPPQNQNYTYLQTNRADDLGSLWSSFNIDLQSNLGTMRTSPRLKVNTSSADDANLGRPVAFKFFNGKLFAVCGTRVFVNSDGSQPQSAFTEDASTNAQTDYLAGASDLEIFNGQLFATTTDALVSLNSAGGTWTARGTALTSAVPHNLCYFKKFNRLYYLASQQVIRSIDTSYVEAATGDYSIDLTVSSQLPTCMRATSDSIWIGIFSGGTRALGGRVFQWDGISPQITNQYKIDAQGVLAMTVRDNIPYVMDTRGRLLRFSGNSFDEVGRLPIPPNKLLKFNSTISDKFIHPNGLITTENNTILALISNELDDNTGTIPENCPSGVWEWSEQFGFTHKYSFTYNPVANSTITDFGQNRISLAGALANVNYPSTNASRNGTLIMGATYFTNATTTADAIFIDDSNNTVQKNGYAVTTWFNSREIQDKWERAWTSYRRLLDASDSIIVKYRLYEEEPTYATITWVNTTSFTTTTDISAYGPTATGFNGTQGGEVEFIHGVGSGLCAHITNISEAGGTYTVTIDETATGATTTTGKARFQKWIKLNPSDTQDQVKSYSQAQIGASNNRIQFKICFTFTGDDEFFKLAVVSNEDIKITP